MVKVSVWRVVYVVVGPVGCSHPPGHDVMVATVVVRYVLGLVITLVLPYWPGGGVITGSVAEGERLEE